MQYRTLAALALVAALAACGSDDGPDGSGTVDPSQARVTIVSGDGQSAQVPDPAPQSAIVPQAVVGEAMLPDPLVVRVTGDGPQSSITGPSMAVVPEGTPVHWRIPDEGCGEPFGGTTLTDAVGQSTNRVILGTVAGECTVQVGRVLSSGDVVIDSTFVYELLPGPVASILLKDTHAVVSVGDTIDIRDYVIRGRDAHRNDLTAEEVVAASDSLIQWAWWDRVQGSTIDPKEPEGEGWLAVVPSMDGYLESYGGYYGPGLRIWVNGGEPVILTFRVPVE